MTGLVFMRRLGLFLNRVISSLSSSTEVPYGAPHRQLLAGQIASSVRSSFKIYRNLTLNILLYYWSSYFHLNRKSTRRKRLCAQKSMLEGQCHKIFGPIFSRKTRPGPHMNRLKWFRELFRFLEDIRLQSSNFACPRSQRLLIENVQNCFSLLIRAQVKSFFLNLEKVENNVTLSTAVDNKIWSCAHRA